MNINRNNYESWFLDYLDGKLNAGQIEKLMLFLEFNPDLKQEIEGMELIQLKAEEISYQQKKTLRKPAEPFIHETTHADFETLCISSIEQQLSQEEEGQLQDLLKADPEKEKTYSLYMATIIEADRSISYPGKSLLKKRFIDIPSIRVTATAVAAAAVIFLTLSVLMRNPAGQEVLTGNQEITVPGDNLPEKEIPDVILSENPEEKQVPKTAEIKPIHPESSGMGQFRTDTKPTPTIQTEKLQPQYVRLSALKPIEARYISPGEGIEQKLMAQGLQEHSIPEADDSPDPERGDRRISFWKLADAGIQRINELSEEDYSLERKVDEQGQIRRFTFETPIFGISTPMGSTDQPQ